MKEVSEYYQELADWFYHFPVDKTLSYELIGAKMRTLRKQGNVTQLDVGAAVSMCRVHLELTRRTTIINIRNKGYKLATPKELALYAAKCGRRTVRWADRTWRALEITDRKLLPAAVREVFPEQKIRTLSKTGQKFVSNLIEYTKNERRKLIHVKSNGKK